MAIKIAGLDLQSRVGRESGNTGFHRPETEFSLYPPLLVVVPFFHKQKDRLYNCRASFSVTGHFKNFAQNQTCLICDKDDMALKTSTKVVVYTNKCICPGSIW